ncbi:MAG TPA: hypothetical protein VJV79_33125 [Polyangiaceae bacterium]|nr:hypothetical protein [Polyangiaceae bacterium]
MKPDPIEQLAARLFEVARNEAVPTGAEQRALQAIARERRQQRPTPVRLSARRVWLAAAAAVALAAGFALLLRPKEAGLGISAEPAAVARTQLERQTLPRVEAPSQAVPTAPSLPAPSKLPASAAPASAPVRSAPASLSDELSALKIASTALSAGDTQGALTALDRYDRVLKGQKMRAEATLLRIEALSRAGQTEAASALAQRFVQQNPGSPLVDRARSFVHE